MELVILKKTTIDTCMIINNCTVVIKVVSDVWKHNITSIDNCFVEQLEAPPLNLAVCSDFYVI